MVLEIRALGVQGDLTLCGCVSVQGLHFRMQGSICLRDSPEP